MKNYKAIVITNVIDEYWRGILRGISHYVNLHGNWEIMLSPYDFIPSAQQLRDWGSVGIITHPDLFPCENWPRNVHVPIIYLDNYPLEKELRHNPDIIGKIAADERGITEMAFHYLQNQGVRHFAYVCYSGRPWSPKRKNLFAEFVQNADEKFSAYLCREEKISRKRYEQLQKWLLDLPKPVGILAGNDKSGRIVLATCYNSRIKVPEEVAVIGVDNDPLVCQMSIPHLTSIVLDTEQPGYDALQYLEQVLHADEERKELNLHDPQKKRRDRKVFYVTPIRVIIRESTHKQIWNDEYVNHAYDYIQNHAHDPILVDDVVREVPLSKRLLQKRFREITGSTINDFIRTSRLKHIKIYLKETDFSIKQIAQKMKFSSPSHLIHFFRHHTGQTPLEYREESTSEFVHTSY